MIEFFRRKRRRASPSNEPTIGQRISTAPSAAREHARRLVADCHVTSTFVEPDGDEYALWRAGKLVSFYLTALLDAGGHCGPEVDAACGAEEPAVGL